MRIQPLWEQLRGVNSVVLSRPPAQLRARLAKTIANAIAAGSA